MLDNGTKKWEAEDNYEWDRDLIKDFKKRESMILIKENNLNREEERLTEIKNEISGKKVSSG